LKRSERTWRSSAASISSSSPTATSVSARTTRSTSLT